MTAILEPEALAAFPPTPEAVPESYELTSGDAEPVNFDPMRIEWEPGGPVASEAAPGYYNHGTYIMDDGTVRPVAGFRYHKIHPATGSWEHAHRVIIVTGTAYGVHPNHAGQDPAHYMVGPDIGRYDPWKLGEDRWRTNDAATIAPKHFSDDCVDKSEFIPGSTPVIAE